MAFPEEQLANVFGHSYDSEKQIPYGSPEYKERKLNDALYYLRKSVDIATDAGVQDDLAEALEAQAAEIRTVYNVAEEER